MARPTKFTDQAKAVILKALRNGNTRTASAQAARINHWTLTQWINRYPEFRADVEKAEADAERRAVGQIRAAMGNNWTAAAWWLERRRPKDWGKVDRVEVTFREQAQKIADELGLSVDDVIAEAERIVAK